MKIPYYWRIGFWYRHLSDIDIKFICAVLKGIWVFGLLAWGYTVANINIYPSVQFLNLSEYVPIPENLFADLSFVVAFFAFVLYEMFKPDQKVEA